MSEVEVSITINPEYTDEKIMRLLLDAYAALLVLNGADKADNAKRVNISANVWPRVLLLEIGGERIVFEAPTIIQCLGMDVTIKHDLNTITLIKDDE